MSYFNGIGFSQACHVHSYSAYLVTSPHLTTTEARECGDPAHSERVEDSVTQLANDTM